jgi:DNA repair photolyase
MEAWRTKQRIIKLLEERLGEEERKEARQDPHARRRPRPCGLTIHTGVGCPLACAYCYIYDMGFPGVVRPYGLSPLQMAYAVAVNPHMAVGPWGSLIAVGSVTEPFLPETRELALGYIKSIATYLGNPIPISTKMPPPYELAEVQKGLDMLISVTDTTGKLEPKAPPPLKRLKAGAELMRRGVSVTLFVRPIVPGVTDRDSTRLLALVAELGYRRVVFGTLRVTKGIVTRLKAFGIDVTPYIRELHERRQTPIRYPKEKFITVAKQMGFEVLPASCAANVVAHGQACALCRWGPCGDVKKLKVDIRDVEEYLETRGYKSVEVSLEGLRIRINKRLKPIDKIFLEQATRMPISESAH